MNANLSPDCLIALGIMHQVRYPLYYIKKLNLKLSKEQEEKIYIQRKDIEKQFDVTFASISRHLSVLKEADLILLNPNLHWRYHLSNYCSITFVGRLLL